MSTMVAVVDIIDPISGTRLLHYNHPVHEAHIIKFTVSMPGDTDVNNRIPMLFYFTRSNDATHVVEAKKLKWWQKCCGGCCCRNDDAASPPVGAVVRPADVMVNTIIANRNVDAADAAANVASQCWIVWQLDDSGVRFPEIYFEDLSMAPTDGAHTHAPYETEFAYDQLTVKIKFGME